MDRPSLPAVPEPRRRAAHSPAPATAPQYRCARPDLPPIVWAYPESVATRSAPAATPRFPPAPRPRRPTKPAPPLSATVAESVPGSSPAPAAAPPPANGPPHGPKTNSPGSRRPPAESAPPAASTPLRTHAPALPACRPRARDASGQIRGLRHPSDRPWPSTHQQNSDPPWLARELRQPSADPPPTGPCFRATPDCSIPQSALDLQSAPRARAHKTAPYPGIPAALRPESYKRICSIEPRAPQHRDQPGNGSANTYSSERDKERCSALAHPCCGRSAPDTVECPAR